MTEEEWLSATDPTPMLEFLADKVSERKLRLFAIACCLSVCNLTARDEFRMACLKALKIGTSFVDGKGNSEDLLAAWCELSNDKPRTKKRTLDKSEKHLKIAVLHATQAAWEERNALGAMIYTIQALRAKFGRKIKRQERLIQCRLLRCIVGNPLRPVAISPVWLAWHESTVSRIAEGIYEEQAFDRLPILADALEDADCTDAAILDHLRGLGPHVRGCHVIDLLLGKK